MPKIFHIKKTGNEKLRLIQTKLNTNNNEEKHLLTYHNS
jgi:hypothetical protein